VVPVPAGGLGGSLPGVVGAEQGVFGLLRSLRPNSLPQLRVQLVLLSDGPFPELLPLAQAWGDGSRALGYLPPLPSAAHVPAGWLVRLDMATRLCAADADWLMLPTVDTRYQQPFFETLRGLAAEREALAAAEAAKKAKPGVRQGARKRKRRKQKQKQTQKHKQKQAGGRAHEEGGAEEAQEEGGEEEEEGEEEEGGEEEEEEEQQQQQDTDLARGKSTLASSQVPSHYYDALTLTTITH
jgi:hypothetical protein